MPDPKKRLEFAATILVVDDDSSLRGMLREFLTGLGFRVIEAGTGIGADKQLRNHPVDLLMIDLVMPDREGIETIRAVRAEFAGLPILAMSGSELYLNGAALLGADMVLQKPFDLDRLQELLFGEWRPHPARTAKLNGTTADGTLLQKESKEAPL